MCIAICVPTRGNPAVLEDVLSNSISLYKKYGIDVYYFDSSDDAETKHVVQTYIEQGYDNLFYVKMDVDSEYGDKVEYILEDNFSVKTYEYLWPMKNRSYCNEDTLLKVLESASIGYEAICVGAISADNFFDREYDDAAELYKDFGWLSTSLDVVIFNSRILKRNYSKVKNNYSVTEWEDFAHYIIFYEMLSRNKSNRIRFLYGENIGILNSHIGHSEWLKKTFDIWAGSWITTNEKLPSLYNADKNSTIKKATSLPWILGNEERLKALKRKGVFNVECLEKIEKNWERISYVPIEIARKIASGNDVDACEKTNEKNEIINLLLEICEYLESDKMSSNDIPIDDIYKVFFHFFKEREYYSYEKEIFLVRTLADMKMFLWKSKGNAELVVRILISMFLLLN